MSNGDEATGTKPSRAGYAIGAVFALFIVGGILLAIRAGGDSSGSAHVSSASGDSNGLDPDEREGIAYRGPETVDLIAAADLAECRLREDLPAEGRGHLGFDDPVPEYETVPPTSGDHINPPFQQADGAWADPAETVNVVHSLEHGRIAIQYDQALPEADQLEIKGLYDSAYSASLLFPNPEMPYAVAATAWRNLIGCPDFKGQATLDAIRAFGVAHWGQGPEDLNGFPALSGPDFGSLAE